MPWCTPPPASWTPPPGAGNGRQGVAVLYLYNGRRAAHGRRFAQWFFYWFYPLHLLALGLLRVALL